jgi:predicted outer membrane protein
LHS